MGAKHKYYLLTWDRLPEPNILHHFFRVIYNLLKTTKLQTHIDKKHRAAHVSNMWQQNHKTNHGIHMLHATNRKNEKHTFCSSEIDFHWQCKCDWPFHFIKNSISFQSGSASYKWLNRTGSVDLLFLVASSAMPFGWCHSTFSMESPSSASISS